MKLRSWISLALFLCLCETVAASSVGTGPLFSLPVRGVAWEDGRQWDLQAAVNNGLFTPHFDYRWCNWGSGDGSRPHPRTFAGSAKTTGTAENSRPCSVCCQEPAAVVPQHRHSVPASSVQGTPSMGTNTYLLLVHHTRSKPADPPIYSRPGSWTRTRRRVNPVDKL
ncbi:hypothetical protein B0H16DRAFT_730764 [Mycena metata]|uniref:Uncharacterized protein n=1 Tax=Mycena metata TaxID=1033252 RepID=A0AAD7J1P7_9AGAR|nr:hypothetical protein B0H16DRAFT_730764 [Mycena metata]